MPWYIEFGLWWLVLCALVAVAWWRLRMGEPRDDE
jgi:hypothetical protein